MGCCSQRRDIFSLPDQVTKVEESLRLSDIETTQFFRILQICTSEGETTLAKLIVNFSKYRFGKLLGTADSVPHKMIMHPMFEASDDTLDVYRLLSIGFLYTHGSSFVKFKILFATFDYQSKLISRDTFGFFLKNLVRLAGEVLPAICYQKNYSEATSFASSRIEKVVEDTVQKIFKDKTEIEKDTLKLIIQSEFAQILNPTLIRARLQLTWTL